MNLDSYSSFSDNSDPDKISDESDDIIDLTIERESILNLEGQSTDDINALQNSNINITQKPEVGLQFDSIEDAEYILKNWAKNIGFEMRRGRRKSGSIEMGLYIIFFFLDLCINY